MLTTTSNAAPPKVAVTGLAQLELEAELARGHLGAIEARHIHSDEVEPIPKGNERPPEVERLRPGAADVQNAQAPGT